MNPHLTTCSLCQLSHANTSATQQSVLLASKDSTYQLSTEKKIERLYHELVSLSSFFAEDELAMFSQQATELEQELNGFGSNKKHSFCVAHSQLSTISLLIPVYQRQAELYKRIETVWEQAEKEYTAIKLLKKQRETLQERALRWDRLPFTKAHLLQKTFSYAASHYRISDSTKAEIESICVDHSRLLYSFSRIFPTIKVPSLPEKEFNIALNYKKKFLDPYFCEFNLDCSKIKSIFYQARTPLENLSSQFKALTLHEMTYELKFQKHNKKTT